MRTIIWITLFLMSGSLFADGAIPWQYQNGKKMEPSFAPSLNTAKTWAAEHYKEDSEIIRFEYSIWQNSNGYEVMITAVYKGDVVAVDGAICVNTNNEHKYVKAKQCMAP